MARTGSTAGRAPDENITGNAARETTDCVAKFELRFVEQKTEHTEHEESGTRIERTTFDDADTDYFIFGRGFPSISAKPRRPIIVRITHAQIDAHPLPLDSSSITVGNGRSEKQIHPSSSPIKCDEVGASFG
jgi:hypothetical protein